MPPDSPTVAELLREQTRARGDHRLLVCDAERISYADADRRSGLLARGLIAFGAGKGTHVGLLYPKGVDFVVALLAPRRIGALRVRCSPFTTEPEMQRQLAHSDVEILLAAPSYRSHDYAKRLARVIGD